VWSSGAAELLTTEGARRRARLELAKASEKDPDAEAAISALDDYRRRFATKEGN
jgi:outer membrane protein assembly factor BamD (BamD/ComL family)